MKGVIKTAPGIGNIEVGEVPEPQPGPEQVVLEVKAAGLCGTDLHIYYDEFKTWPPVVLGHEVVGQVVEVGPGVSAVKAGDRVTTETYFSTCGKCRFCRAGRPNLCPNRRSIGSAVNGGFTRYLLVPEKNIHLLPENVDFKAGALTEPLACVVHAVLDLSSSTPGDLALVSGPGTIGLLTMQVLKAAGAEVVVLGANGDEPRLELARQLGANYTLNVQQDDVAGIIAEMSNGLGADGVYECSGAAPAAPQMLELVRRGGQYTQVGLFGKPVPWLLDQLCYKEVKATGSNASVPAAWDRALKLMGEGKVQTAPLVTAIYPITEWRAAFDTFEKRTGLKTLLQPVE